MIEPERRVPGREEMAVCVLRAAGAEDDVRPDQPGEEHDLGGQEQPHRHLAGSDGGRVGRDGGVAPACPAGFGWAVLGVAIAIVISTLLLVISHWSLVIGYQGLSWP